MAYTRVNWKDAPGDKTTPLNAANLNKMDEGISQNSSDITALNTRAGNIEDNVSELNSNLTQLEDKTTVYYGEEKVVGTWIDGKPIYRQCFTLSAMNKRTTNIPSNIGVIAENIINIGGCYRSTQYSDWHSIDNMVTRCVVDLSNVYVQTNFDFTGGNANVYVEYTKK